MEKSGEPVLKVYSSNPELHLVLITDLHLAYRYVLKKWHLGKLRRMIRSVSPDMIVNTGDLFCERRRFSPVPLLDLYMKYIGNEWPWAFTWGKHDLDGKPEYLLPVETFLDSSPRILYARSKEYFLARSRFLSSADVDAANLSGNYVIELYDKNASAVTPSWMLFFFNSGTREHVSPLVLDWARERCARYAFSVPSVCFMHRPVLEMKRSSENGNISGFSSDSVSSGEDSGNVHEGLRAMRTVRACFCGHDHGNNFTCEVDGIFYHASRKSLSLSYGTRSGENSLRKKKHSGAEIGWGVTDIALGLDSGSVSVKTILESGEVIQAFRTR